MCERALKGSLGALMRNPVIFVKSKFSYADLPSKSIVPLPSAKSRENVFRFEILQKNLNKNC